MLRSWFGAVVRYRLALSTCALAAAMALFFILRGLADAEIFVSDPTKFAFEATEGDSLLSSSVFQVCSLLFVGL